MMQWEFSMTRWGFSMMRWGFSMANKERDCHVAKAPRNDEFKWSLTLLAVTVKWFRSRLKGGSLALESALVVIIYLL